VPGSGREKKFDTGVYNAYTMLYYRHMNPTTETAVTPLPTLLPNHVRYLVVVQWEWDVEEYVITTPKFYPPANAEVLAMIKTAHPRDEGAQVTSVTRI
jgi:hypothetical protein